MRVRLRPARVMDAGPMGDILYTFQAEMYGTPKMWSGAETIAYCGEMIARGWVTVAEAAGCVVGFLACDGAEICGLYVAAGSRDAGIGRALIDSAKKGRDGLWLKVLEQNAGARRFYARHGFAEVARSDGAENDDKLPDISMEWQREGTR